MEGGIDKSRLTSVELELLAELRKTPIFYRHFSDLVIAHAPLRDNIGKFPGRAIYGILCAAAVTFVSCMSRKWPIRGSIELGLAMDIDGDEIYGPAISRAYNLESKVAQYPRIVVGEELIRYLKLFEGARGNPALTIEQKINVELCVKSVELLVEDDDGQVVVDYLGAQFRNAFPDKTIVQNAYNFIIEESIRHKELRNSKLGFRYTLLRNYFESKITDWGFSIQSE
jgi:hypothetical protein